MCFREIIAESDGHHCDHDKPHGIDDLIIVLVACIWVLFNIFIEGQLKMTDCKCKYDITYDHEEDHGLIWLLFKHGLYSKYHCGLTILLFSPFLGRSTKPFGIVSEQFGDEVNSQKHYTHEHSIKTQLNLLFHVIHPERCINPGGTMDNVDDQFNQHQSESYRLFELLSA